MSETPSANVPSPLSYVSEEARHKFTVAAAVMAGVFVLAQVFLPALVMLILMPTFLLGGISRMETVEVNRAAAWGGRVWYVTSGMGGGAGKLKSVALEGKEEPAVERELLPAKPYLLAAPDRLWLITSEFAEYYQDGEWVGVESGEELAVISRPFFHQGRPAVIETEGESCTFRTLTDEGWDEGTPFLPALVADFGPWAAQLIQAASVDDELFLFVESYGTVYCRTGLPEGEDKKEDWTIVTSGVQGWCATRLGDEPVVFYAKDAGMGMNLVGEKRTGGKWMPFLTVPGGIAMELAAFPTGAPGEIVVVSSGFPGSFTLRHVAGGEVVGERQCGRGMFPFGGRFWLLVLIPQVFNVSLPIIFAFILTGLMATHRVGEYQSGTTRVLYASLARRGLAQLVDSLIAGGPIAVAFVWVFSNMQNLERMLNPAVFFGAFALIPIAIGWGLLWLCILSAMEGSSGQTPGKYLLGICVIGTDLRPCGFWRALLRNLLEMVDGFFSFMVGILLVAFTERWQRAGDLAARTIVIRKGSGRTVATPDGTPGTPPV